MYTVCPKCTLTLVVTAADLRAAQGFVRCGRCSNVFNALARLSEDRNAVAEGSAAATVSRPAPPPAPPLESSAASQSPAASPPASAASSSSPAAARNPPDRAPETAPPGREAEEDPIPETALEFDPRATDIAKVFIEQTPDPKWSAATGRFRSLSRAQPSGPASAAAPPSSSTPASPADEDESGFEIEIDPQLLAATAATGTHPSTIGSPPPSQASSTGPSPQPSDGDSQAAGRAEPPSPLGVPAAGPPQSQPLSRAPEADISQLRSPDAAAEAAPQPADTSAAQPPALAEVGSDTGPGSAPSAIGAHGTLFPEAETQAAAEPPALRHLWRFGSIALVLLLAGQLVNHYRHDLAANEHFYGPLTTMYSALGVSLVPRWNIKAYDVRQLGASAEGPDSRQLTVRASIRNTAQQAQPLPLLRVTLQDRFGNRIAARDVPPGAYLRHAPRVSPFLSAGQRIDAEMAFVDPGSNAVGFEIDACLPTPGGSIACANDAAQR